MTDKMWGRRPRSVVWYLATLSAVLVVPLLTVAGYVTWRYVAAEQSALEIRARETTSDIINAVDRELAQQIAAAEALATSPSLAAEDFAAFRTQAAVVAKARHGIIVLQAVDGRQLVNTGLPMDMRLPPRYSAGILEEIVRSGAPVVTDLFVGVSSGVRRVAVGTPVRLGGEVRFVLTLAQDLSALRDIVAAGALPDPYVSSLADRKGFIIARSAGGEDVIGKPLPGFDRAVGPEGTWSGVNIQGVPVFGTYRRSALSGWIVGTGVTQAALFAPVWQSLLLLAGIAAAIALMALVVAFLLARRIALAASGVAAMASELGRGDPVLDRPLLVTEAKVIGDAMQRASRDLKERASALLASRQELARANSGLERTVAARTRQLADSEARYRLIAETTNDIIIHGGISGPRSYVSPSVTRVLGYSPDEVIVGTQADFVHPDDRDRYLAARGGVSVERPEARLAMRVRHRDGHWIWVDAAYRLGGSPDSPMVVATIRDISERQQAAEELRVAKEAAESANLAKSEFLATMSHEMRTPLTAILGFARLVLDRDDLTAEVRRQVGLVQTAGSSLLTVVNDVLDLSKIEAGGMTLNERPFRILDLTERLDSVVRPEAEAKGLSLDIRVAEAVPAIVVGDDGKLRQILLNLLNNAVKFTNDGDVRLRCGPAVGGSGEAGRPTVRFEVEDTGIGVPEHLQHRLFQRFSQVEGSISREYGGTGLGLAITKNLAEMMGGGVGVVSRQGRGALFWCEVQLRTFHGELPTASFSRRARAEPGCRVLVVDDGAMNREIARTLLARSGLVVDEAEDGASAIRMAKAQTYDLILMDIQMPGMDGLEATRRIRALGGRYASLPIVALTANVLVDQVERFREAGMDGHIGKPFDSEDLISAVMDRIGDSAARVAAAKPAAVTCDPAKLDQLVALLGAERVAGYLSQLDDELGAMPMPQVCQDDAPGLVAWAHKMAGQSGMLGFGRLSAACSGFEAATVRGQPSAAAATEMDAARLEAIAAIPELTGRLAAPA